MGPVNWPAVVVAASLALAVHELWHGRLSARGEVREAAPAGPPKRAPIRPLATFALLLLPATMMGHMFARVGGATLALKPWLFAMMSGGLALAFVVPALLIGYQRHRLPARRARSDAAQWIAAYLAMGAAFWVLG